MSAPCPAPAISDCATHSINESATRRAADREPNGPRYKSVALGTLAVTVTEERSLVATTNLVSGATPCWLNSGRKAWINRSSRISDSSGPLVRRWSIRAVLVSRGPTFLRSSELKYERTRWRRLTALPTYKVLPRRSRKRYTPWVRGSRSVSASLERIGCEAAVGSSISSSRAVTPKPRARSSNRWSRSAVASTSSRAR